MASSVVDWTLELVAPPHVDARIEALEKLVQEVAGEEQRDRMTEILAAVKGSPHRSKRNGS